MIEKQEEGSNTWEKVPGLITDTSHTVKGLKEGKTYKFRVKAENLYGVSEPLEGNRVTAKNPFGQWIAQPAFFYFFFNFILLFLLGRALREMNLLKGFIIFWVQRGLVHAAGLTQRVLSWVSCSW